MANDFTLLDKTPSAQCKLEHKTIGSLRGKFFVPAYQRGYRWGKDDVRRLLDDIWESQGNPYSLQPVVVKLRSHGESESPSEWELIDGQQRLTTLYLVLQYMKRETQCGLGAPYTLSYETRPGSEQYLQSLSEQDQNSNIDFYHLYQADRAIDEWFQKAGDKFQQNAIANDIHRYLFNAVRIIWYEASPITRATDLFTRLNIGRIPLTDAELVKAALLTKIPDVASADRAQEIAAQWDGIERDLHRKDIWAFVAGLSADTSNEQYDTRISLLLDTLADNDQITTTQKQQRWLAGKRPLYHTFDQLRDQIEKDPTTFWSNAIALHAKILGWFDQPKLYNKIGFLVASGNTFGKITQVAQGMKKSDFDENLTKLIQDTLNILPDGLEELRYNNKHHDYPKLVQLLLLINIETVSKTGQRFPFARHIEEHWSLEHIHAQNAEGLNKAEQWRSWLETHCAALDAVKLDKNPAEIGQVKIDTNIAIDTIKPGIPNVFSGQDFSALSGRILKLLSSDESDDNSIHSIRNMALISKEQNSGLSNSVFEVKRQKILDMDRNGEYVPICTRNVFLKYYADADALQPHFWSRKDKDAYLKAIRSLLQPYLKNAQAV